MTSSDVAAGSVRESRFWHDHFRASRARAWEPLYNHRSELTPAELLTVRESVQQFQRGESSRGRRLLRRGLAFSVATRDRYFVRALRLFIEEENRHGAYLLSFMERHGIAAIQSHWVDATFRVLRGLAGLELSLRVLVTAEIIAVPYYRALRGATGSELLRAICQRILQDEAAHLRYQASMLRRISKGRGRIGTWAAGMLHRLFLAGTLLLVWLEHGPVFRASCYTFRRFACEALEEFAKLERSSVRGPYSPGAARAVDAGGHVAFPRLRPR